MVDYFIQISQAFDFLMKMILQSDLLYENARDSSLGQWQGRNVDTGDIVIRVRAVPS